MDFLNPFGPKQFAAAASAAEADTMTRIVQGEGLVALSEEGFIECPGKSLHTTRNRDEDCRIYFNQNGEFWFPQIHCFHQSCTHETSAANRRMFYAAARAKAIGTNPPSSAASKSRQATKPSVEFDDILANYRWTYEEIRSGPSGIKDNPDFPPEFHHLILLRLFDREDILWIAEDVRFCTPKCPFNFRTMTEWDTDECPGIYICPNPLIEGIHSRSEDNVRTCKYLVVESDTRSRDEIGAVFKWMQASGYKLRAIVDTGNKSLHGWFDYPPPKKLPSLKRDLISLGCDKAMFNPSQPCRLPGAFRQRTENYQQLIYFDHSSLK